VIESMTGARLAHDTLSRRAGMSRSQTRKKVKGLAPLACKADKIDSRLLAVLSHRDLVPAIWLPDPHQLRQARAIGASRWRAPGKWRQGRPEVRPFDLPMGRLSGPWARMQGRPCPTRAPVTARPLAEPPLLGVACRKRVA
jgi:hypothetical protein